MASERAIEARIRATEFEVTTGATREQIVVMSREAAAASQHRGYQQVVEADRTSADDPNSIGFVVKVGAKVAEVSVHWRAGDHGHDVSLRTRRYTISRPTVAGVIPVGRRKVPGIAALERFSEALQARLSTL